MDFSAERLNTMMLFSPLGLELEEAEANSESNLWYVGVCFDTTTTEGVYLHALT